MVNILNRYPGESITEFKHRLYVIKLRDNTITWDDVVHAVNCEVEPLYRRQRDFYSREAHRLLSEGVLDLDSVSQTTGTEDDGVDYITEVKKERYKLTEERTQLNAYVRKLAREDTLKEIATNFADKMSTRKLLCVPQKDFTVCSDDPKEGILCISDWHYGIEISNYFNTYNPDICRERVGKLVGKVIKIGTQNKLQRIHVVNLSDLICGRIHLTLRLESREDVISQTMEVCEILAEFLSHLSQYFIVDYYDCLDNHSRLEPNKKDSMELETLARIIPWYLKTRLKDNKNIIICNNTYADDIIAFNVLGHNVVGVHGHKDKPDKIIDNMTSMTRRRNELIVSAHYHHFSCDESHECLRISNGSLMGVDTYAQDLRLTNKPSQNLIISTKEDVAEAIYKINVE